MVEPLEHQTIGDFLEALASNTPTPGGGSVAALSGAMAAGLVGMVCSFSIGKKQFAEYENDLRTIQSRASGLQRDLQTLANDDIAIFERLSSAYKLPRTTDADAATRRVAIQQITRQATEIPLRIVRASAALIPLCTELVNRCGRLIVSDVGVAALLAQATVRSAILSIEINLAGIEDQSFVYEIRNQLEDLTIGLFEEAEGLIDIAQARIRS